MNHTAKNAWAALLQEATKKRGTSPEGDGWITAEKIRAQLPKMGDDKFYSFLRDEIEADRIEKFDGHVLGEKGKLRRQVWYRIKPKTS